MTIQTFFRKLWQFGYIQALCCIFPVAVFATLAISKFVHIPGLPRYDFILIVLILVQVAMVKFRLETLYELKVILLFHIIGLVLEIFKVHMGSWSYPEFSYVRIADVPLYSGFMYASIGSYVVQAWKRFDLKTINWPSNWLSFPICVALYLNFFTEHFIPDLRYVIMLAVLIVFWRTKFQFKLVDHKHRMPAVLSFALIGFFIWVAEDIGTFLDAWRYPDQVAAWRMVSVGKITSWLLLVIISIVLVANLKHIKAKHKVKNQAV